MKDCKIIPGQLYVDRKNLPYQICMVGEEVDLKETMVVYQALFGAYPVCIKRMELFLEEYVPQGKASSGLYTKESDTEYDLERKEVENQIEKLFLDFLDAQTSEEKLELLYQLHDDLDERLVNNIAISMDLPADEEDVEKQYDFIVKNLKQRARFECNRFRR